MKTILMLVHILGGGDRPDIALVPQDVMGNEACAVYAKTHDANTERVMDVYLSRPIVSSYYSCVYIDKPMVESLKP